MFPDDRLLDRNTLLRLGWGTVVDHTKERIGGDVTAYFDRLVVPVYWQDEGIYRKRR